jgi:uncharacterized iron-regulated membrane protein
MKQITIRRWFLVHKWTSIVCTAFLLLLCITGLPLIFEDEIDALSKPPLPAAPPGPPASLDAVATAARAYRGGDALIFISRDDKEPTYYVTTGPSGDSTDEARIHTDFYDARTGRRIEAPPLNSGVMASILRLHAELLLGLPGELFLGLMGLLLAASLVSGTVVYAPFMRKLSFGTVRKDKSSRVRWLDTHNMIGVVTLAWLMVVGLTGVTNTLATPIAAIWQRDQLGGMTAAYRNAPPPKHLASLDAALRTARAAAPGMEMSFIAFPGTGYSSKHHYAVFMRGDTPPTNKLVKPALIDAGTGALTGLRDMPLYVKILFLSQPLHFGNYGGLPMKIIWALLDIAAIVVLGSGLYLWWGRRRTSIERHLARLRAHHDMRAEAIA